MYSYPGGDQTDYQAFISITFATVSGGVVSSPFIFTQNLTGGVSYDDVLVKYNVARSAINDGSLIAFAQSNPSP